VVVSRRAWVNGEVACPKCSVPLDAERDTITFSQASGETRWSGAKVLHQRCGHAFRVTFTEVKT